MLSSKPPICDLAAFASASNSSVAAACCVHFALPHAACQATSGTITSVRTGCYAWAAHRLRREEKKWLGHVQEQPRPEAWRQSGWRSQHGWFREWRGCFSCANASMASCCSGRGRCVHGVCACDDGAFGIDCRGDAMGDAAATPTTTTTAAAPLASSAGPWRPYGIDELGERSSAARDRSGEGDGEAPMQAPPQPQPATVTPPPKPRRRSLALYVYEDLPLDLGAMGFALRSWHSNLVGGYEVYSTEWRFLRYLLADDVVLTRDGDAADLYVVPTLGSMGGMPGAQGGHRCMQPAQIAMLETAVRRKHPYWDRSGGRDHVFFLTSDQGACGLGAAATAPIFVSAWGLMGAPKKMEVYARNAEFASAADVAREMGSGEWCHAPHKDIVVPPYGDGQFTNARGGMYAASVGDDTPRFDHTLLHVGGIWGNMNKGVRRLSFYSQGMRQQIYTLFGDERGAPHGFAIVNRSMKAALLAGMTRRSKFCLAPSGHGWGMRTGKNAFIGCVPLISQPFVMQPYEMVLPYEAFSRRVGFEEIPSLPAITNATDAEIVAMRRRLVRVRRAFAWRVEGGGLAYNHTLLHLCQRAVELRGRLRAGPHASCAPLAAGLNDAHAAQHMPRWFPPALARATLQMQAERRTEMAAAEREAARRGAGGGTL